MIAADLLDQACDKSDKISKDVTSCQQVIPHWEKLCEHNLLTACIFRLATSCEIPYHTILYISYRNHAYHGKPHHPYHNHTIL